MVNVSDGYKTLATAAGREIFCTIEAGDKTFTDSEIVGFELDDVVHSEEMAFGTTCSNRFHFELRTDEYIPLSSVIKPYIRFEGSAEACPLGVFYIAKRYRRRNRYSITCYDKMYQLDSSYETALAFPCSAQSVLDELCENLGITSEIDLSDEVCDIQPAQKTCREVIGYLAGLTGACAKFDRYGNLCFKLLENCGFRITRDNYKSLSLTQDACTVEEITIETDDISYTAGDGSRLTNYVQYNPFGTQALANKLLEKWEGFSYHGMEIEMQGLPFLESGDSIEVQNDTDNGVFLGIISEIELTYDGSLWAKLTSKSKNPVDEYEDEASAETEAENIEKNLTFTHYSYMNSRAITARQELTKVIEIDVLALKATCASFNAQLVAQSSTDCTLTLEYRQDDAPITPVIYATLKAGEQRPLCLYNFLPVLDIGYNNLKLYARTNAGSVSFAPKSIVAAVSGQCLAAEILTRSPNRTVYETVTDTALNPYARSAPVDENLSTRMITPTRNAKSETLSPSISMPRSTAFTVSVTSELS